MTKYNILNAIKLFGVILLAVIITIEYYNNIIFSPYESYVIDSGLYEQILSLLRISLWKIHYILGVILFFIFLVIALAQPLTIYTAGLLLSDLIVLITGLINTIFINDTIRILHVILISISVSFFIAEILFNKEKVAEIERY